jgi:flagellar assembly protein FliH
MSITRHQATGAYRRWTPPAFDEHEGESTIPLAESTEPAEIATEQPPEREPPPLALPTADEVEAIYEQARSDGEKAGFAEGRERAGKEEVKARDEAKKLAALVKSMDEALDRLGADVSQEIVELAVALARQMVGDTLEARPDAVVPCVREALQHVPQGKVRIHLHPEDVKLVRSHLDDHLESGHHHLIEDDAISRGGCRLEANNSDIDATVETRWQRVLAGIGRDPGPPRDDE